MLWTIVYLIISQQDLIVKSKSTEMWKRDVKSCTCKMMCPIKFAFITLPHVYSFCEAKIVKSYFSRFREKSFLPKYLDRVPYFSYLTKKILTHLVQIWQLTSYLDTLSPFWSQSLIFNFNRTFSEKKRLTSLNLSGTSLG